MSIEVSLTKDGIGVVYTSLGVLTGQDLLDADSRLRSEVARGVPIRYLLVDHSAVPEERIDTISLQVLAQGTGEILDSISEAIVAVVAPSDVLFGLSRMWESMAEQAGLVTHVMRTREEAVAWLEEQLSRRHLPCSLAD